MIAYQILIREQQPNPGLVSETHVPVQVSMTCSDYENHYWCCFPAPKDLLDRLPEQEAEHALCALACFEAIREYPCPRQGHETTGEELTHGLLEMYAIFKYGVQGEVSVSRQDGRGHNFFWEDRTSAADMAQRWQAGVWREALNEVVERVADEPSSRKLRM